MYKLIPNLLNQYFVDGIYRTSINPRRQAGCKAHAMASQIQQQKQKGEGRRGKWGHEAVEG